MIKNINVLFNIDLLINPGNFFLATYLQDKKNKK